MLKIEAGNLREAQEIAREEQFTIAFWVSDFVDKPLLHIFVMGTLRYSCKKWSDRDQPTVHENMDLPPTGIRKHTIPVSVKKGMFYFNNDLMTHTFTDTFPAVLEKGVLYISNKYKCCVHLCPCGCGEKIHIPTNQPPGWSLSIDNGVTLHPSLKHRLPCKSHYFIKEGKVERCTSHAVGIEEYMVE